MKTIQHTTRLLRLALACGIITFAASAQAGKPVKPPTPPPEPPPPSGPAYRIIAVEGGINPWSLTDLGTLVGSAWYQLPNEGFQTPAVLPPRIASGEPQYLTSDLRFLPGGDGTQKYGYCIAMNVAGIAVGYLYDPTPEQAMLWREDGTAVNLGIDPAGLGSTANDINDAGLVLVGVGHENEAGEMSGVVVPLGGDADVEPDTWFADVDTDGMNDLFFPIDAGHNLLPLVINEDGQVLAAQFAGGDPVAGYLLTPDLTDADGDGNPWFADENGDGFNDLLVALDPPDPGASVIVADLNDFGQVAGHSGGHAVRWEFVEDEQIVTDLGSLGDKVEMTATGISDSGRIVGNSRIPTGRRSKAGPSWLSKNETMYELLPLMVNSAGWSDLSADGINRDGWIQGRGLLDGVGRTFVAIPVEEP